MTEPTQMLLTQRQLKRRLRLMNENGQFFFINIFDDEETTIFHPAKI